MNLLSLSLWFRDTGLLGGTLFRLDPLKTYFHSGCQRSQDFHDNSSGAQLSVSCGTDTEKREKAKTPGSGSNFQAITGRTVNAGAAQRAGTRPACSHLVIPRDVWEIAQPLTT